MFGLRLRILSLATLCLLAASAAQAADITPPPPPPQPCCSNWYLRGNVGIGLMNDIPLDYTTTTGATLQQNTNEDTYFIDGGVGYYWNNWLRFDLTAEYRAKSRLYALVTYPPGGIDEYQGNLSSWVFLANAYVDLGTWNCFTPFLGAGFGGAYNTLSDFSDVNPNGGYGFGHNPSEWHPAWALYAGVSYDVTNNLKVELAYRYLNYGSITDTVTCSVTCTQDQFKFKDLSSNDIMLSLRWSCCEVPSQPTPARYVYSPPPLSSKD